MASRPLSAESDDTEEASPVTAGAGPSTHRGCSQPLFPVHRFWYGWKMQSFDFTAVWHACPQSLVAASAVNVSDLAS